MYFNTSISLLTYSHTQTHLCELSTNVSKVTDAFQKVSVVEKFFSTAKCLLFSDSPPDLLAVVLKAVSPDPPLVMKQLCDPWAECLWM